MSKKQVKPTMNQRYKDNGNEYRIEIIEKKMSNWKTMKQMERKQEWVVQEQQNRGRKHIV